MAPIPIRHAYKFFSSAYLGDLEKHGRIKIGTPEEYRVADGIDDGRSDKFEMIRSWQPGAGLWELNADHPLRQSLLGPETDEDAAKPIRLLFEQGTIIRMGLTSYLFCMSRQISLELMQRMYETFGCDMYFKITDVAGLMIATTLADKRLRGGGVIQAVKYTEEARSDPGAPDLCNAFIKHPRYAWQDELRFVWDRPSEKVEPFLVDVPDLHRFIEAYKSEI